MVWRAYYKTWGALEALARREVEQNLRFQGQYYDAETGLHYNTFRYYDPVVGRFTTQDPIGLLGGENLYQYGKNPQSWLDPLGWCSTKLGQNMGARSGDGMANHYFIPEELMKHKAYEKLFSRLKAIGFDGDGAPNGIFLPGSQSLAKTLGLPGHWSSHRLYTEAVNRKLTDVNRVFLAGRLTDTQLALGIGKIQSFAREGLESGKFVIDQVTSRLL